MELKEGKIRISRKEMREIKKMDHSQMERKLTEAMEIGYCKDREGAVLEENNWHWRQAVEDALEALPGIGVKRKELFMEYLRQNLGEVGICIR